MQPHALDNDGIVVELRPERRRVEGRQRVRGGGLNDVMRHGVLLVGSGDRNQHSASRCQSPTPATFCGNLSEDEEAAFSCHAERLASAAVASRNWVTIIT